MSSVLLVVGSILCNRRFAFCLYCSSGLFSGYKHSLLLVLLSDGSTDTLDTVQNTVQNELL